MDCMYPIRRSASGLAIVLCVVVPLFGTLVPPAHAEETDSATTTTEEEIDSCGDTGTGVFRNPIKHCSVEELLLSILDVIVTIILIPIVVLSIIIIGFKMVVAGAQGNSEEYAKLKKAFGYALIGLFIVLAARGILEVVKSTVSEVLRPEPTEGTP